MRALAVLACAGWPGHGSGSQPDLQHSERSRRSPAHQWWATLLTASGGAWQSPLPSNTSTQWQWWRCSNPFAVGCQLVAQNSQTYRLTDRDNGAWIASARWVKYPANADCNPTSECLLSVSAARGPVSVAATPTPPAGRRRPCPRRSRRPSRPRWPRPRRSSPRRRRRRCPPPAGRCKRPPNRMMRPAPVVRMRGVLIDQRRDDHARSRSRRPKAATLTVTLLRLVLVPGQALVAEDAQAPEHAHGARSSATSRSGTQLTVTVTRAGYVGKRTVFKIRRGKAPLRSDSCLSPATGKVPEVSRWLKVTIVMAAAAFVVAFRFAADGNDADATSAPRDRRARERRRRDARSPSSRPCAWRRSSRCPALAKRARRTDRRAGEEGSGRAQGARGGEEARSGAQEARSRERRKKAAAKRKREAAAARRRAAAPAGPPPRAWSRRPRPRCAGPSPPRSTARPLRRRRRRSRTSAKTSTPKG